MIIYRIKNKDGLFSNGGHFPYFTKKGKIWKHIGHVKLHLKQLHSSVLSTYQYCTLETYEIKEEFIRNEPIVTYLLTELGFEKKLGRIF